MLLLQVERLQEKRSGKVFKPLWLRLGGRRNATFERSLATSDI
jgi:hypothetical protein